MALILADTPLSRSAMYPLSLTRPVGALRLGILTLQQWWQAMTGQPVFLLSEPYLQTPLPDTGPFICVDATVLPDGATMDKILALQPNQLLEDAGGMIAFCSQTLPQYGQLPVWLDSLPTVSSQERLNHISDIFKKNEAQIKAHFTLLCRGRQSATPHISNTIIGKEAVFLEEGVEMYGCTINALAGPVYIGKNALVMEGTTIRGPVAVCEGGVVKMGAQLYAGTTIGPYCTAGGEIKNTMMAGFSNKAHHGYLGDAVVGEWCNLGAGTTNSNVKNTGGPVKMWDNRSRSLVEVGQKGGLVMGDYSRSAINSSFNTGTTIGVSCNIFDGSYPPKHLPPFSWGNHERYGFEKACADAANWKRMKGKEFSDTDRAVLAHIWENIRFEI